MLSCAGRSTPPTRKTMKTAKQYARPSYMQVQNPVRTAPPGTLLARTRHFLDICGVPLRQITAETGLPYLWLYHFKKKRPASPDVNRTQALYEFLTGENLEIR